MTAPTSLGQKTMADSVPVTIASDQGAISGAGSAALGQATMAASSPVVLASNQSAIPTQDAGPSFTNSFGVSSAAVASANMSAAAVAITDAPTAGQYIVVDDIIVSVDTAMTVTLTTETTGTVKLKLYLPANGLAQLTTRGKFKLAVADKKLMAQSSVAGNIAISAIYHSEA